MVLNEGWSSPVQYYHFLCPIQGTQKNDTLRPIQVMKAALAFSAHDISVRFGFLGVLESDIGGLAKSVLLSLAIHAYVWFLVVLMIK